MLNKGTCYVIGAGECYGLDFRPSPGDYVIAADGGLTHLEGNGLAADMVIGDFDSSEKPSGHPNVIALNKIKDDTDAFAAVREGISRGYKKFKLYCCTGGRFEHTIANMQLVAYLAENKMKGLLIDRGCVITAVANGEVRFDASQRGYVSVFSYTDKSKGVYLTGLKYELADAELTNTFPLGVSNEFTGQESAVRVTEGTLIIIYPSPTLPSAP